MKTAPLLFLLLLLLNTCTHQIQVTNNYNINSYTVGVKPSDTLTDIDLANSFIEIRLNKREDTVLSKSIIKSKEDSDDATKGVFVYFRNLSKPEEKGFLKRFVPYSNTNHVLKEQFTDFNLVEGTNIIMVFIENELSQGDSFTFSFNYKPTLITPTDRPIQPKVVRKYTDILAINFGDIYNGSTPVTVGETTCKKLLLTHSVASNCSVKIKFKSEQPNYISYPSGDSIVIPVKTTDPSPISLEGFCFRVKKGISSNTVPFYFELYVNDTIVTKTKSSQSTIKLGDR